MREMSFSPQRAIESLLFLAGNLEQPTIHEVLKLRYFADKIHLSKFGFMASGDTYSAMKFGPVASHTYNMLKAARGERSNWIHPDFVEAVEDSLVVVESKNVRVLRAPNLELLATSDVECMKEALSLYGNMPFSERTELSHDTAWTKAWDAACNDSMDASDMGLTDIAETLENSAELIEHFRA